MQQHVLPLKNQIRMSITTAARISAGKSAILMFFSCLCQKQVRTNTVAEAQTPAETLGDELHILHVTTLSMHYTLRLKTLMILLKLPASVLATECQNKQMVVVYNSVV